MRLSPLDIHNHRFGRRLSGYDREEVDSFLRMVAEDYEASIQDANGLRERVRQVEARLEELSSNENVLRDAIVSAQGLCEELKRTAVKEAELMISESEVKAEKLQQAAHRRAAEVAEDIREMKRLRTRLATAIRKTIELHLSMLDGLDRDPEGEFQLESKIAFLAQHGRARKAKANESS